MLPFSASTLEVGFMMAESAEIGLRIVEAGSLRSMMITSVVPPTFSLKQIKLSDSIVRVANPIDSDILELKETKINFHDHNRNEL